MNRTIIPLLALAAWLNPVPVCAKTVILEPSTPWNVVYEDDDCLLARVFGKDKAKVVLRFQQASPTSPLRPAVHGSAVKQLTGPRDGLRAAFGLDAKLVRVPSALAGSIGTEKEPALLLSPLGLTGDKGDVLDFALPAPENRSTTQHFKLERHGYTIALHTGPLTKVLDAMNTCTQDLVKSWGLDPVQQSLLSQRATPQDSPGGWLKSNDYPTGAVMGGRSAEIQFRLVVDKAGMPSACKVQDATNSPEFIDLTCKLLMRRAHFTPARTAEGEAVETYYTNSVRWIMPES